MPTEVLNEQEGKTDREHERILNEIETTDTAFIGASLRAVYEGNDHEKFLERLDSRIKQHDRDIEKMCNFHYQGFIESITELINVRSDAERLKSQTVAINKELQDSGKELARKNDDLIQCEIQQCNVAAAIEKLTICLPVLQLYSKMCELMRNGRYYSALKTLEQLEHTHLPNIHAYRFCEIMLGNIPKFREKIKEASMSNLKDFLENVRKNSAKIGMVAMKQVEMERNLVDTVEVISSMTAIKAPTETQRKPVSKENHTGVSSKKKSKAPVPPPSRISPQHQPRLNPFNDDDPDEEVIDSSNPFEDKNPFLQPASENSNPFENGPTTNPFSEVNDASSASFNNFGITENSVHLMNGVEEPQTASPTPAADTGYKKLTTTESVSEAPDVATNLFLSIPNTASRVNENKTIKGVLDEKAVIFSTETGTTVNVQTARDEVDFHKKEVTAVNESIKDELTPKITSKSQCNLGITAAQSPKKMSVNAPPQPPIQAPPRRKKKKKIQSESKVEDEIAASPSLVAAEPSAISIEAAFPTELTATEQSEKQLQPNEDKTCLSVLNNTEFPFFTNNTQNAKRSLSSQELKKDAIPQKPIRQMKKEQKEEKQPASLLTCDSKYKIPLVDGGKNSAFEDFVGANDEVPDDVSLAMPKFLLSADDENDPKFLWKKKKQWQMPRISYDLSASDLVDFSPVYKCLHIFGLVGARAEFETYYRTQRRRQARLALDPPTSLQDNLEAYANYFHEIVGFFVVEDHILHTAPNLISKQFMNDLWDMTISKLLSVMRTDSNYATDGVVMMKVKNLIVVFADTLKAYGFTVNQLFSLLMNMRDQYGEILLKRWAVKFNEIFDEDNYTGMQIDSEVESQALLASFPYDDPSYEQSPYPRKLPFSRFVPRIYNEIKNFILACLKYCEDLHLSATEVDDMIRKSTNLLLTRTLSSGLEKLVEKPHLGLTELVQIITNTKHLENSCRSIEEYVHSITGVKVNSAHSAKLVGVSTFKDARSRTESQIYLKLNNKIDEFFELAEYSWQLKEPLGMASRYLKDLIAFLQHNFEVFTTLPVKVAQTACMSACRHITTRLTEMLLDPEIKTITMAALQQFNLDVIQCEAFSNSEPVPGFEEGVLQLSFVELRQLLDLFLSWDWSSYLADYGSGNSKYLRVNPGTALTLLEKIKEERGHRNIFASINKQEREKKKLLETVIKQLRAIVNEGSIRRRSSKKRSKFRRRSSSKKL